MNTRRMPCSSSPVYVGIDVHKKSYSLTAIANGQPPVRKTMAADPEALLRFLKKEFKGFEIVTAYEAGFSGFCLHRTLEKGGIRNLVVHPASIEIAVNNRVKTDKRDSAKIAQHLSQGRLSSVEVPSVETEELRLLHRTREQLVLERTRIYNQIKSRLHQFGLLPHDESYFANAKSVEEFTKAAAKDSKTSCLARAVQALRAAWCAFDAEIKDLERDIKHLQESAARWPEAKQLSALFKIYESIPGIGFIGAQTLATELGDMSRFENERRLFSFLGLTPSERSSGESVRRGHITHQGSGRIRRILTLAAWKAIKEDDALKASFENIKARRGSQRAIVAISRKLIGRVRACIRKNEVYRIGYEGAA